MWGFLKPKKNELETTSCEPSEKLSWGQRLKRGLSRTRNHFSENLTTLVLGKKVIDDEFLEELEVILLSADVGINATHHILGELTQKVQRKELNNPDALLDALKHTLQNMLEPYSQPLKINASPFVILMVGVNGAGKTTSIAKLAHHFKQQGKKVMLAAGDTFRAAAVEQLQVWGERNDVPVIAQQTGADSASVIYDGMQAAKARKYDILIADTAGRLHTQEHLMRELQKIKRVIQKFDEQAPHETMLIIDSGMGQNALNQAEQFNQAINLSSITLTKLDGTAKGGIIFAITQKLKIPVRFIGVGEQVDDLKPFDAKEFVDALFAK